MGATRSLQEGISSVLIGNTTLFGTGATLMTVGLFKGDVTVNEETTIADLDIMMNNDGEMLIEVPAAPQTRFLDPLTGTWKLRLNEPAGGFTFEMGEANPLKPTVRGWYVVGPSGTLLYAKNFPEPIVITDDFQSISLPEVVLEFFPGMFR